MVVGNQLYNQYPQNVLILVEYGVLIDDLYYAFENKQNSEYFLGALVLKRTREKEFKEYEILDGQQRLTTLCMMMAVLRDLMKKPQYKWTLSQMIYQ